MAYDALAESIALIESRQLRPIPRLSRRRRFVPMAVDVAGDVAGTMFLRRGSGCDWQENWLLARRGGRWRMLGGGGGSVDYDSGLLADRPDRLPDSASWPHDALPGVDPRMLTGGAAGWVRDTGGGRDLFPWSGRRISYTVLFASARVAAIEVDGRQILVPWHGHTLIVWPTRRPGRLCLRAADGAVIGRTRLPASR